MKIKMVLFDLDGTLLPMDQDVFIKAYFSGIAERLAPHGYEPERLIGSIWKGTEAMIKNDGSKSNETAFWDVFSQIYGEGVRDGEPYFDAFYRENFDKVKSSCGFTPKAKEVVNMLTKGGVRVALATNPIFPAIATQKRIAWAGLEADSFELITTYENSRFCKPNLKYYKDIFDKLGVSPAECLMVGNDVGEDMVVKSLGAKVFLLTDCLINKRGEDVASYPHGDYNELMKYIASEVLA